MRIILCIVILAALTTEVRGQGCCSGGAGSPIAGGASQGVLMSRQIELAMNYQHFGSDRFLSGDRDTAPLFSRFNSNYTYFRAAAGLSENLTMSVESGYFLNKTQIGLSGTDTIRSAGIGDLILFPRYRILDRSSATTQTEITVGMGLKIPLGHYRDSTLVFTDPSTQQKYYTYSPPIVQPTNGSNDLIFYGFFYRGYPARKFRVFANMLYIRKGWNPIGQKFGDYATVGLFAGKTFFNSLGATLQLKGEWLGRMQAAPYVDMLALYNIDIAATGGYRFSLAPQLSYSGNGLTVYALAEIPLYQYVNRIQVGAQNLITVGISYRFSRRNPLVGGG